MTGMTGKLGDEVERQIAAMREGSVDFYGEESLRERLAQKLSAGRPLRVKLGMDPSSPDLHLGHTVVLHKLRLLQELGHTPIFLIGDFTARIGDPSGRKKTRPALDADAVRENARTYVDQVSRVLDVGRAEVRFNSEWMERMSTTDFVRLCSRYTVARLLERDDFAKRIAAGDPISVHELMYPFVQAYDSVVLEADIELGGTDQTFNLLMAREIQRDYGQPPQAVITHPLLVGLDGVDKMSKSLGNLIGITERPEDMYGKLMSVSDGLMLTYFDLLRAGQWSELLAEREALARGAGDPLAFKQALAHRVVARFHGEAAAARAAERFRRVIQEKQAPDDVALHELDAGATGARGLLEVLESLGLVSSRGEARRLIEQKGVQIDGGIVGDPTQQLARGEYLLRVGKRRFARVRVK
jgi:tyrosyl-tRNA synthetase